MPLPVPTQPLCPTPPPANPAEPQCLPEGDGGAQSMHGGTCCREPVSQQPAVCSSQGPCRFATSCSITPGSSRAARGLLPRSSAADLRGVTAGISVPAGGVAHETQCWPVPADGSRSAVGDVTISPTCYAARVPARRTEPRSCLNHLCTGRGTLVGTDYLIFERVEIYASRSRHSSAGVTMVSLVAEIEQGPAEMNCRAVVRSCSWQDGAVVEFRSQSRLQDGDGTDDRAG